MISDFLSHYSGVKGAPRQLVTGEAVYSISVSALSNIINQPLSTVFLIVKIKHNAHHNSKV